MCRFLKSLNTTGIASLVSLSIWIVAILINAIADVVYLGLTIGNGAGILEALGFILLFSALFSLPGIIIFWLVFLFNTENKNLFGILLTTAIITPVASLVLLPLFFGGAFTGDLGWLIAIAVLSAMMSVIFHYRVINEAINNKNETHEKAVV